MSSRMSVGLSLNEDIAFLLELKPSELTLVIEESVLDALNNKQEISLYLPSILGAQSHENVTVKRVKIMNPLVFRILNSFKKEMRGVFVSKSISDYAQSSSGAILMKNLKARLNPDTIIHLKNEAAGPPAPRESAGDTARQTYDKVKYFKHIEGDFV